MQLPSSGGCASLGQMLAVEVAELMYTDLSVLTCVAQGTAAGVLRTLMVMSLALGVAQL